MVGRRATISKYQFLDFPSFFINFVICQLASSMLHMQVFFQFLKKNHVKSCCKRFFHLVDIFTYNKQGMSKIWIDTWIDTSINVQNIIHFWSVYPNLPSIFKKKLQQWCCSPATLDIHEISELRVFPLLAPLSQKNNVLGPPSMQGGNWRSRKDNNISSLFCGSMYFYIWGIQKEGEGGEEGGCRCKSVAPLDLVGSRAASGP